MQCSLQLHPLLFHDQTYGGAVYCGSDIAPEIDNVRMSLLATAVCSDSCRRSINVQLPRRSASEIAMQYSYVGGRSQSLPVRYTYIGSLLLAGCLIAASVRRNRRTFAGAKLFFCNSTYWYRDGVWSKHHTEPKLDQHMVAKAVPGLQAPSSALHGPLRHAISTLKLWGADNR